MIKEHFDIITNHLDLILLNLEADGFKSQQILTIVTKINAISLYIAKIRPGLFDLIESLVAKHIGEYAKQWEAPNDNP